MDQSENIEILASNFDRMDGNNSFMKQTITKFYSERKYKINFKECHIAISRNGGLIAICKKQGYLDIQKGTKINDNVLIMFQNSKKVFYIPIDWDYKKHWIISLDFIDSEQLYGLCFDGTIFKFDIVRKKAIEKPTSSIFQQGNIEKAKFIKNGFIALTSFGAFYYVPDIKHPSPSKIFEMNSLLDFSNDVDFIAIPPSASKSGKLELLFTNEKGNGVIHIVQQPEGYDYQLVPNGVGNDCILKGVSVIVNDTIEDYIKKAEDVISTEKEEINLDALGKISALAISPSYSQIAFYNNSENVVYFFSSQFDKPKKKAKFEIDQDLIDSEINEQKTVLSFQEGYQFLYCGEDAVAISGQRFIILVNTLQKTIVYKIAEEGEIEAIQGALFSKCISEIDGLRYVTNEGVFMISKVPNELFDACYPFSDSTSRKLLKAYRSDLLKEADCDSKIRDIRDNLPDAVENLQIASANIYWTNDENEGYKREIQQFLIKASQYGKYFLEREDFNYDKFVETCKKIRIVNNLRNDPKYPRFITYREYEEMIPKDLISKILRNQNFALAYDISIFLEYNTKKVYQQFAYSNIKRLKDFCSPEDQNKLYEYLIDKLKPIKNISYIKLAKKAFKYHQNELGMKFLDHEKSILTKIPQYLEHKKWDKALELSYKTFDTDILATAIDKTIRNNTIEQFIEIVKNERKIKYSVVDYLLKNQSEFIETYFKDQKNYEEILFYNLENFFKSNSIDERKKYIKSAKESEKKIDSNNFNHKFYRTYLNELENSIKFKNLCMDNEKNIIKKNNIEPFDNSIYDCYKLGYKLNNKNNIKWIEAQNKDYELSNKKMSILKIRTLAENNKFDMVENLIKESSLKKLNLTPKNMAELYLDYKRYDKAVEYIKQMNENDFGYKVEMLMYMEKYEDALEVIISSKNNDRIPELINAVLSKRPGLQNYVQELCTKYKVNLS